MTVTRAATRPGFDAPALAARLDLMSLSEMDELDFGLIVADRNATVIAFNDYESHRAGIAASRVLGRNLFTDVAPCIDNDQVAQRYADTDELDEQLDWVFTVRMSPSPVRLRLLHTAGSAREYLAIRPR